MKNQRGTNNDIRRKFSGNFSDGIPWQLVVTAFGSAPSNPFPNDANSSSVTEAMFFGLRAAEAITDAQIEYRKPRRELAALLFSPLLYPHGTRTATHCFQLLKFQSEYGGGTVIDRQLFLAPVCLDLRMPGQTAAMLPGVLARMGGDITQSSTKTATLTPNYLATQTIRFWLSQLSQTASTDEAMKEPDDWSYLFFCNLIVSVVAVELNGDFRASSLPRQKWTNA